MLEIAPEVTTATSEASREQHLQRRVLRLLMQHSETLLHRQFSLFFVESALPPIPLLQQYDRFVKLRTLSGELLNDILPRIRRELSLKTSHSRLREEAPTRGDIDWPRSLERAVSQQPGLPPLQFETRLRQRTLETPENVLVVAILLIFRQEIRAALNEQFEDEELSASERQVLVGLDEQAERELAAAYARVLIEQASRVDVPVLVEQVSAHLRPGPSPYRDLLAWWQRFKSFRIGRGDGQRAAALTSKRANEKTTAWLYELWIMLEILHLLDQEKQLQPHEVQIATDTLQCTFHWHGRAFRLLYNRQLDTSTSYEPDWEHGPATRPDYAIERVKSDLLEIRHNGQLIWREPPVVLDAKYYLEGSDPANTHGPIKKLLGDMTLLGAQHGALFFPELPEPSEGGEITRTLRRTGKQYTSGETCQIHLYHLDPQMPLDLLQQRLRAILDLATDQLPERSAPVCLGRALDEDTINAGNQPLNGPTLLCPKPHVGPRVFDLVNVETDCLKNPLLCHVMDQAIIPPFVLRTLTLEQLEQQAHTLRTRGQASLQAAEQAGDDARAELIRARILRSVSQSVEQYVALVGHTEEIEERCKWIFEEYWQEHRSCLDVTTRRSLVSGEHIWKAYGDTTVLQDWAAPAIQYCRTLEFEIKRRFYTPCQHLYRGCYLPGGFTLGTLPYASQQRKDVNTQRLWHIIAGRVASDKHGELEFIARQMLQAEISKKRNALAHGTTISKATAAELRELVIGRPGQQGLLRRLAELVDLE